jgi:hypothetical protein
VEYQVRQTPAGAAIVVRCNGPDCRPAGAPGRGGQAEAVPSARARGGRGAAGQAGDRRHLCDLGSRGSAGLRQTGPVTERELLPGNVRSTANLFGLPGFYQYGLGSAGFGAWRELAAHTMTTNWVLSDEHRAFALLYHWRLLPGPVATEGVFAEFGGLDGAVAHWESSAAVRDRLQALRHSPARLVLFLEHVPQTLPRRGHPPRPGRTGLEPGLTPARRALGACRRQASPCVSQATDRRITGPAC